MLLVDLLLVPFLDRNKLGNFKMVLPQQSVFDSVLNIGIPSLVKFPCAIFYFSASLMFRYINAVVGGRVGVCVESIYVRTKKAILM